MNIVGENFPKEIVKQINVRQSKKGAKNRNNQNLVWQNSNTGWVKMISSVNIDLNDRTKVSNKEMSSILLPREQLAQEYVLFGGTYYQGKNKDGLSRGIARDKSILNHSSYGLGGLDLGLRPMPGITSFSIKSENRGSLRTATIGIKCYNRHQFDIINTLYLSLGYSVLIEWGNVMYYDNNGKFEEENPNSLADKFLHPSEDFKWNSILDVIQKKRLESCGNYDASLGKVVNFNWTLNKDLSYDINVIIRSVGDVIESLKMNALSGYIPVDLSAAGQFVNYNVNSSTIVNDIPAHAAAFEKIVKLAIQFNSPDPKLTAAIAMTESGWFSSENFKLATNPFGQTINDNQIGTEGIIGKRVVTAKLDGKTRKFAVYDSVDSAVKMHIRRWGQYYVPGSAEKTTLALIAKGYTPDAGWKETIANIYNRRKNLPLPSTTNATTSAGTPNYAGVGTSTSLNTALKSLGVNVPITNSPPQTTAQQVPPSTIPNFLDFITGQSATPGAIPGATPGTEAAVGTDVVQDAILPTEAAPIEVISKYAYTHDVGALFYNMMVKINADNSNIINGTSVDAVKILFTNNGAATTTDQYYVRLGYFLQELEKNIIYRLKSSDKAKIIKLDYDMDSNIILLYNRQLSANPNVCIFQRSYDLSDDSKIVLFPELNKFTLDGYGDSDKKIPTPFYGKIMNTYFNMKDVLLKMEDSKNADTGVLTLIDLLKILTKGFCDSTGNYNKIEPTVDADTNTIKFIDSLPLPDVSSILKQKSEDTAIFKMYGYYANENSPNMSEAGIVRDLSLTTTVSPNLATMLTIGAQANGYITGQDSTALSVMNYGLIDRVKEEWIEPSSKINYPTPPASPVFLAPLQPQAQTPPTQPPPPSQPAPPPGPPTLEKKYENVIDAFNRFIQDMATTPGPTWNQDDVTAFTNSIQSFAEYNQAEQTLKIRQNEPLLSSPNIGFLPFDLTLTIDGLSGMKIYQKFVADTEFLPSNYPQSLEFLIKGITHEIKDNQWITRLESLAVPKNPFGAKDKFNVGSPRIGQQGSTERAVGAAGTLRSSAFTAGGSSSTACGKTVIQNLNAPVITPTKIDAFQKAFKAVFAYGEYKGKGRCGRWTYNLAYNFADALKGKQLQKGDVHGSGNDADSPLYRQHLKQLGYTEILWGQNVTKAQIQDLLNNNLGSFAPGDVVAYFSSNHKRRHTQMFTGGYGVPGYNWATDKKLNFRVNFVYNNPTKYPENCYTIYLFRAPDIR
jgi:hypothetical protein